ncbi:TPA: hypothetical protein DD690_04000 [Candidatus Daviesbacteria bacterium]|uniref:Uncharacterized protein n=1 Tax=Candidatus Daviesbacteria bacterium GW2011_GWF2_38_6 TaxID=1618432 RepID=A0A0G0KSQ1_9BACT|nr:MAG: hypothetical protein US99_C0017G0008 [Candidatus Daviesbacteria bacterium GW2011_GWF2_38_6]OGE26133.1 MAG: hypothetical protein A3D02_00515 [Candidatus Daviesbacteria bacterium RIFCSPHIGHO2_02_FULL_39_41]OGE43794.1 MAG: hypothetical protein A3E67_03455 [Candidatus Daviesbacteria bacterium RIFCSPHIGHO2_12_FULL_38_25]OGE68225.1 MAG: hypothetical protein A3H81_04020 [Candidatus Daviesbacteria bacterium RIFCSPLOWO2_02_FULL_38_18]OGE72338.1 MAG: hypothetical protein A3H18_01340 [Candidatus D
MVINAELEKSYLVTPSTDMLLATPPVGVSGEIQLFHGNIRTFGKNPPIYDPGSLVIFASEPRPTEVYIMRRSLTAEEINRTENLIRNLLANPDKNVVRAADKLGITSIINPNGEFLPVRLLASQQEIADHRESLRTSILNHPFSQKLREPFRNIRNILFDGNAFGGHALYITLGLQGMWLDLIGGIESEPTILSLGPTLALIPALLLPYTGYDRRREQTQAHLITFGPTIAFGFTMGGIVSSFLLKQDIVQQFRDMLITFPAIGESSLSISNLFGLGAAIRVLLAYIETGYMSRDNRYEKWVFLDPPLKTRQLIGKLQGMREHILADRFIQAFLRQEDGELLREDPVAWDYYLKLPEKERGRLNPGIVQQLVLESHAPQLWSPMRKELRAWFNPETAQEARHKTAYTRRPRRGTSGLKK